MSSEPALALADIICERIAGYLQGKDRAAFERDGLVRDAVERCLERICEAANRLGAVATTLMPNHPWHEIRGTGNRLRHAYDRINTSVIWDTVKQDLPTLERSALDRLPNPD